MAESATTPTVEEQTAPPENQVEEPGTPSRQDKIDEVATILAGDDDKKPSEQAQVEEPQKAGKPETLDALAELAGVEVSDLYEIAIKQPPGPGGEDQTVTLGELADLAKDKGQFELDRVDFEESKSKREAEIMRAHQQLTEIIGMLPKHAISQDLVNTVQAKMADDETRERGLTLQVIPTWNDQAVEASERKAIQASLSEYGFSPNYLETVKDHRTLAYIRDNWQRKERMERALAAMRKKPGKAQKPSAPGGAPTQAQPKRTPSGPQGRSEKISQVAELLRST